MEILPFEKGGKRLSRTWDVGDQFEGMAVARDQPLVAIGTTSGDVILWNHSTDSSVRRKYHKGGVPVLAFDPVGEQLATASHDKTIQIRDLRRPKKEPLTLYPEFAVKALEFGPENCKSGECGLAVASGGAVLYWKMPERNEEIDELSKIQGGDVKTLSFLADGSLLAGYNVGNTGTLLQVDPKNSKQNKALYTRGGTITALATARSPIVATNVRFILSDSDGKILAGEVVPEPVKIRVPESTTWSASIDGEGRLVAGTTSGHIFGWEHSSPIKKIDYAPHMSSKPGIPVNGARSDNSAVNAVSVKATLSDDGTVIILGDDKGGLSKLLVKAGKNGFEILQFEELPLMASNSKNPIDALAVSAKGELIAAIKEDQLWYWHRGQASQLVDQSKPPFKITAVTVSVDGCWLAYGIISPDGEPKRKSYVRLKSMCGYVATREEVELTHRVTTIAFSRDGRMLAFGTHVGEVNWWRAGTDQDPVRVVSKNKEKVTALAFGRDSFEGILVVGDQTGLVRGWNLAKPNADPFTLLGHEGTVMGLGFAKVDGAQRLISVDMNSQVLMWRHASGLHAFLCELRKSAGREKDKFCSK